MNDSPSPDGQFRKLPVLMILISSLVGIILLFNLFKLPSYYTFYKHLENKYPDKTFKVNWVEYDFLNNRFYSKACCTDDGTTFYLHAEGKNVSEDYWETNFGNKIHYEITKCIEKSPEHAYVRDIAAETKLGEFKTIEDFKKMPLRFYVDIESNRIKSTDEMAQVITGIITTLTEHGFHVSGLFTYAEIHDDVYSLNMEASDINKSAEEIAKMVERVRK